MSGLPGHPGYVQRLAAELGLGSLGRSAARPSTVIDRSPADTWTAEGEGPAVVLVHGLAGCARTWDRVAEGLSDDHTVIRGDLWHGGPGASERERCSARGHAALLLDLIEHRYRDACAGGVVLVGHSMGGLAVLRVARERVSERRDPLRGVALLGPLAHHRRGPSPLSGHGFSRLAWLGRLPGVARLLGVAPRRALLERVLATMYAEDVPAETIERMLASLATRAGRVTFVRTLQSVLDPQSYADGPWRADVPSLLVVGESDHTVKRWSSERLATELGTELRLLPACAHVSQEERPEAVLGLLRPFLARCFAGEPAA